MERATVSKPTKPVRHEYPLAASPDVLRSHEKDSYLTQSLSTQASSILQSLLGVRYAHRHSNTTKHLTELVYLGLTTLLGNRTLGEEYCDVIQVEDDTLRLAGLSRRAAYIASVVFAPWLLAKTLPVLRRKVRAKLERSIQRETGKLEKGQRRSTKLRCHEYILEHLDSITSLTPIHALSLAAFYFTGSYYHISKRLFGLRYIFTRRIQASEERVGYEVLGVLLVLQLLVQSTLHVRQTIQQASPSQSIETAPWPSDTDNNSDNGNKNSLPTTRIATTTQTPILPHPRYDLFSQNPTTTTTITRPLAWIPPGQASKCTLCLEPQRDPSATSCGHVFCWTCIRDWVAEKAECPLCRQAVLAQKVLPLRS